MSKLARTFNRKFISPIREFIQDSRAVGITLMICTLVSLVISNTPWGISFVAFWEGEIHFPIAAIHLPHTVLHFINDGLMAFFFLLVGMEIKREILEGELSGLQKATLPAVAAIGGMVFPALLYVLCNRGGGNVHGWGVPMATDIAFSLGILSLLGKRAPLALKILLTALAIIDDLGAVLAIAIFYTDHIDLFYLGIAGGIFALLVLMNLMRVSVLPLYFILGLALWYCMFNSGVHATLAGVLLAFTLPLRKIAALEHKLHHPVSFIILPLFALANTAIIFPPDIGHLLASPVNYGVLAGLIIGKPFGIALLSYIAVRMGIARLPQGLRWRHILGIGMLAGIGFTMSIFIAMLAFNDVGTQITAKLAVIIASLVSGIAGYLLLRKINTTSPMNKGGGV